VIDVTQQRMTLAGVSIDQLGADQLLIWGG
jgi:hypothetical protein